MLNYSVYILANHARMLYVGVTNNLERRVREHKLKLIPGYTKRRNMTRLVYYEEVPDIRDAIAREKELKAWRRAKKVALIESTNRRWRDLAEDFGGTLRKIGDIPRPPPPVPLPHSSRDDRAGCCYNPPMTTTTVPEIATALIPEGDFVIGDDAGRPDEQPAHRVWVSAVRLALLPVTNREYAAFPAATGHAAPRFWQDARFNAPDQPVVGVSWFDAVAYCEWLSSLTGLPYRLPTEAEREKAARGGLEGAQFPWGDDAGEDGGRFEQGAPRAVGLSQPNGYGLLDMAYNVHEWCSDWYGERYYRESPERDPQGPPDGRRRASRGGAWRHQVKISRCSARSSLDPSFQYNDYGFRVTLSVGGGVPQVLFVCVHNAGRSQMAAVLTEALSGGRVRVRSGGTTPADEIHPVVVQAMAELGLDMSRAFPKPLTDDAVRESDVVVTMGCGDACPLYPGKRYLDWELRDPSGQPIDVVQAIRDEIRRRVEELLREIGVPPLARTLSGSIDA